MRRIVVLAVMLFAVSTALLALDLLQEDTWGGADLDQGDEVAVAPDGSVFVAGTTLSFGAGDRDAFLLKYNVDGSLAWQRTYGTAPGDTGLRADEFGLGLAVASDGSAYVTGQFGTGILFLVKFDTNGNLLWERTWGENGTIANGADVGPDGSIYVAGLTSAFGTVQSDALLLKFTPAGDLVWAKTWGGGGFDAARDVAVGADGGIYLAGETNSFEANDAFLVKFDALGNIVWERDWGTVGVNGPTAGLTAAFGVGTGADGSVYITGNAFDTGASTNIILVKFDAQGNLVWERIGGPGFGAGLDVAVAADGAVFVTGNVLVDERQGFGGVAFVAEFTAQGKAKKANTWGGSDPNDNTGAESTAIAPDGTIVIAGVVGAPPYAFGKTSNRASRVDAFLVVPIGAVVMNPVSTLDTAPGGTVTAPAGSETFAGVSDAFMLRLQR
jgi:uncharacterized delta-60 repeat protein